MSKLKRYWRNNIVPAAVNFGVETSRTLGALGELTDAKTPWQAMKVPFKAVAHLSAAIFGSAGILLHHKIPYTTLALVGTLAASANAVSDSGYIRQNAHLVLPDHFLQYTREHLGMLPLCGSFPEESDLYNDEFSRNFAEANLQNWFSGTAWTYFYKANFQGSDLNPLDNFQYNPNLVRDYGKFTNRDVHEIVDYILHVAELNGIPPVIAVNQLYEESIGFDPDVISGKIVSRAGAVGVAQFIDGAGAPHGLADEDRTDWKKSVDAYGRNMGGLIQKYDGDIILALTAYNAGDRNPDPNENPILFAAQELGKEKISGWEWMKYMSQRRQSAITCSEQFAKNAWYSETFRYVSIITGMAWSKAFEQRAAANQNLEVRVPLPRPRPAGKELIAANTPA